MSFAIESRAQEINPKVGFFYKQQKSVGKIKMPLALAEPKEHPKTDSDKLLVERVLNGDNRAFDMLVIKYQSRISRLVSVYIQDFDTAKDVVQESFLRAYRALKNYRGESQFYTWLYRIAVNTSYNYLKSNRNWLNHVEPIGDDDPLERVKSNHLDPERAHENEDLKREIDKAITNLPIDLRSVLVLREIEGLSYEEISEVMECELGTVKSRISRARDRVVQKTKHLWNAD